MSSLAAGMVLGTPGMAHAVEPKPDDLDFILRQIQIAEAHPDGSVLDPTPQTPVPTDVNSPELPDGLRTITGVYNNLIPGQKDFGATDRLFPRMLTPLWRQGDNLSVDLDGPFGQSVGDETSYEQSSGFVEDADPRVISNLIVDMTARNPAAQAAYDAAVDADLPGTARVDHDNDPNTPDLFQIPNRAPDEGLSAPYNSWFTAFGQFFDHGLDLVTKGNNGAVFMPLQPDDPLYDDTPGVRTNFMALTRATQVKGPGVDGILGDDPATAGVDESLDDTEREAVNTTTPFVDQNQTYTSHPSHQVFLREYERNAAGGVVSTGRLLDSTVHNGGIATWADVKAQAADLLGIQLVDADVLNVPLLKTDAYGEYERGPNGYPLIVVDENTTVEGDPEADGGLGVLVPANAQRTNHAFLDDIAHHAVPGNIDHDHDPATPMEPRTVDADVDGLIDDRDDSTYDNEMLDSHFITGDGRGNENIGLTAVHHVFHAEHNLLVDEIKQLILDEDTANPGFKDAWQVAPDEWDGERLFQTAKFMTEMEYQHLVFEEFARKVQPQVDVFGAYQTEIDPAIVAEFAHTVYRFGHSMLREKVARTNAAGEDRSMDLLDAFLNPQAFYDDGQGGKLTPEEGAGALARGMTMQTGSEIDEFVTDGVRNTLLGLPLDLAAINIARARDTGVPSLNAARREFYAATSHAALKPYESWRDFKFGIRNQASLVNFIAAYGKHQSVTDATTVADKRAAAELLVKGGTGAPADRVEFLNSTGAWANEPTGHTTTGLEDVDFWVGGLAEKQMPFGGLLGSTFNFVFETQMEKLQDGDRLYYLTRVAGLNFLTQLEENSFAELVMRTTDAEHLPFDVFSNPDYAFEVGKVGDSGPILDDPMTSWNETDLLDRMNDGTVRFPGAEHVVMGGTDNGDRMRTGDGDDTIWGDGGADEMEGGAGNDSLNGGDGDDLINDLFGDDNIKGGLGNDTINAGAGIDLILAGGDKDFVIAGHDPKETFAGDGDDFVIAGEAADVVFGNEGHDWIEGGSQADALNGEHAEPFFDDDVASHDVLNGNGGPDELHAEGGDDILVQGPGQDFNEGMLGFDWGVHDGDPQPGDSDLNNTGLVQPDRLNLFDFYDLTEGLSGWNKDDVLRGDSTTGTDPLREGHQLSQEGVDLIDGLAPVVEGVDLPTVGNVILGGAGNDLIEGRGGDDVIDGDKWVNVQLKWTNPNDPSDTKFAQSMGELQAEVFRGDINPADIETVRTVETPTDGGTDTVVFSGPAADYQVDHDPGAVATVSHTGGSLADGTDTLRNVEVLQFTDALVTVGDIPTNSEPVGTVDITGTPVEDGTLTAALNFTDADGIDDTSVTYTWQVEGGTASVGNAATFIPGDNEVGKRLQAVVNYTDGDGVQHQVTSGLTEPVANVNDAPTGLVLPATATVGTPVTIDVPLDDKDGLTGVTIAYQWQQLLPSGTWADVENGVADSFTPGREHAGRQLRVIASYTDQQGTAETLTSGPTQVAAVAPGPPANVRANRGNGSASLSWDAPVDTGGSPVTGYEISVYTVDANGQLQPVLGLGGYSPGEGTTYNVTGLTNGTSYAFRIAAHNTPDGTTSLLGAASAESNVVVPAVKHKHEDDADRPGAPAYVEAQPGVRSVRLSWPVPEDDGGSTITGYRVQVLDASGNRVGNRLEADTNGKRVRGLDNGGSYAFEVWAVNDEGWGTRVRSDLVTLADRPGGPRIRSPRIGHRGGQLTVTPRWRAPGDDGGSAVTGYRVLALRVTGQQHRRVQERTWSPMVDGRRRSLRMVLPAGVYRFKVAAVNAVGAQRSRLTRAVRAR
ncbi:MAG TPA: peroxidase family protein [Nocardioidaceae bacterium]|nr:peroxidase family protein [Nocardioidaceae bacterium]